MALNKQGIFSRVYFSLLSPVLISYQLANYNYNSKQFGKLKG